VSTGELQQIDERALQGFRCVKPVLKLLAHLHDTATERDRAGNRQWHMDQHVALLLLFMFNPICDSLRALQRASQLKKVQRLLGVPRASLGSLSEANRIFDAELLKSLIGELAGQLQPLPHDPRLADLGAVLTLVDGTLLDALPKMAWALWKDDRHRALKAHIHYELLTGVPVRGTLTPARRHENHVLRTQLAAGRLYVLDRGYANYELLQEIRAAGSSFVCRLRDNARLIVHEERPLDRDATRAGIVRDAVVEVGCRAATRHLVRVIEITCCPYRKECGRKTKYDRSGPCAGETLLVVTDRMDLSADVVALIYKRRWQIEVFFRFFKHILGCRHLVSHHPNGIELQLYAAIIACLLIVLWTRKKPNKATCEMVAWHLAGVASDAELDAHLRSLKTQA
jgi:Transposase DDE domain